MEQRAAGLRAERVPFVHATVVFAARPTSADEVCGGIHEWVPLLEAVA